MPRYKVPILPIHSVEDHPNADRLSLNRIRGYTLVSNKLDDGSHRYHPGQLVAYLPLGTLVPPPLLMEKGYWDKENNKGFLGGDHGIVVEPIMLRKVISEGVIFPTEDIDGHAYMENGRGKKLVKEGDDVAAHLSVAPIRTYYAYKGDACVHEPNLSKIKPPQYEVEDVKMFPSALNGIDVAVTELVHGVLCVVGFDRSRPSPFFVSGSSTSFTIKGENLYTKMAEPIWEKMKVYLERMPGVERLYLYCEIIGPGIQDKTYSWDWPNPKEPMLVGLDIFMGMMGGGLDSIPPGFLDVANKMTLFEWFEIEHLKPLVVGVFDYTSITALANANGRKGVVITPVKEMYVGNNRIIMRMLSDKFLMRKKGTNFK